LWAADLFHRAADNKFYLQLAYVENNVAHILVSPSTGAPVLPVGYGIVRLDLFGSAIKVYFNNVLMISVTNTHVSGPGFVGIGDKHGGAMFGNGNNGVNFEAFALQPPSLPFTDDFSVPHLSGLGNPWSVDQGGFNISASLALAAGVQSEAT